MNGKIINIITIVKRTIKQLYYRMYIYIYTVLCFVSPVKKTKVRKYPNTIQLPITYKCNFDCVMCGMHNMIGNKEFSAEELGEILNDKLFNNVNSIGINGGEPFLKEDLVECIHILIDKINSLKVFHFISNGYFTEKILEKLKVIKKICKTNSVKLNLALSIDGTNEMQDFMRGKKGAWNNIVKTFESIMNDSEKFCDYMNIICTITKYNVYNICEVEYWAKKNNVEVVYNIATVNMRIDNFDKVNEFTIFNDNKARMLTQEFFYKKFRETNSKRYFGIYLFVKSQKRYAPCNCAQNEWVTLTPDSQIGYCATHSKNLGSAREESAYYLFNSNTKYLHELTSEYCSTCSHYIYDLNREGKKLYYKEMLRIYSFT